MATSFSGSLILTPEGRGEALGTRLLQWDTQHVGKKCIPIHDIRTEHTIAGRVGKRTAIRPRGCEIYLRKSGLLAAIFIMLFIPVGSYHVKKALGYL